MVTVKCDDRTNLLTMALRANGIPAAYEFVPNWGVAIMVIHLFQLFCQMVKYTHSRTRIRLQEIPIFLGKHLKYTAKHINIRTENNISESLPELFRQEDVLDVTELHAIGHNNVNLSIKSKNSKIRLLICIYDFYLESCSAIHNW